MRGRKWRKARSRTRSLARRKPTGQSPACLPLRKKERNPPRDVERNLVFEILRVVAGEPRSCLVLEILQSAGCKSSRCPIIDSLRPVLLKILRNFALTTLRRHLLAGPCGFVLETLRRRMVEPVRILFLNFS